MLSTILSARALCGIQTLVMVSGSGLGRGWGVRLCSTQVNSEQVSLESLAEAGERLCRPDISRELVPPLLAKTRE